MGVIPFRSRLIKARQANIFLVSEKAEDKDVYFIILVHSHKIKAFLNIKSNQIYRIADYGTVLTWGYGLKPEPEVIKSLEMQFGIELTAAN